jgi:hypothetical protein
MQAGTLIAAILLCSVGGSELWASPCLGGGLGSEKKKGGPRTSRRRGGQKLCKEKRRMAESRVRRGRKSQMLPD